MHLNKPRKVAIARKIGYSEYDPRKPEKEQTLIVQIHQCLIEVSDRSRLACLYVSQAQKDGLGSFDTSVPPTHHVPWAFEIWHLISTAGLI